MRKNWIIAAIVIVLAGIAVYQNFIVGKHTASAKEAAPKPNFLAPTLKLTGLDGQSYKIGGKRDKPLFINFWASWCDPCKKEAPDLVSNFVKYKDKIDLYAINSTSLDSEEDAKSFAKQYKFPFPVLLDLKGNAIDAYRVGGYPTSFLIDKNGVVQDVIVGLLTPKELERKFQELAAD